MYEQLPQGHTLSFPPSYFTSQEVEKRSQSSKLELIKQLRRLHVSSVFDYDNKPVSSNFKKNVIRVLEHTPEERDATGLAVNEPYYYDWLVHANDLEDFDLNPDSNKKKMMQPYPDLIAMDVGDFEILQNTIGKEHGNENIFRVLVQLRKNGMRRTHQWFGLKLADKKDLLAYVGSNSGNEEAEERTLDHEYLRSMFRVTRDSTKGVLEDHISSKYYGNLSSKYEKSVWLSANTKFTKGGGQLMRPEKDIYDFEDRCATSIARHTVNALMNVLHYKEFRRMSTKDKIEILALLDQFSNPESVSNTNLIVENLVPIFGENNFKSTDYINLQSNGLFEELMHTIHEALKREKDNPGIYYKEIAPIYNEYEEYVSSPEDSEKQFENLKRVLVDQIFEHYFTEETTEKPDIQDVSQNLTAIFFTNDTKNVGQYFSGKQELYQDLDSIAQNMRNTLVTLFAQFKIYTDSQRIPYWKVLFFRYEHSAYLQEKMEQDIFSALSERANQLGLAEEAEPIE